MKVRVGSVIGWICTVLVSALTIMSAIFEFMPMTDPVMIDYATRLGVLDIAIPLGIAKLIIVALYIIPRTSTVGFVLMVGYFGGALATNITHQFPVQDYAPLFVVFVLMMIDAAFRKPELLARLMGKPVVA